MCGEGGVGGAGPTESRVGVAMEGGSDEAPEELVTIGLALVYSVRGGDAELFGCEVCGCASLLYFSVAMAAMAEASMRACCSSSKSFQSPSEASTTEKVIGSSESPVLSRTEGGGRLLMASLTCVFPDPPAPLKTTTELRVLM